MTDSVTPQSTTAPLNPFQKIAAAVYGDGDFADTTSVDEAKGVGDTLFAFIMTELDDGEDCASPVDAIHRLESAIRELQDVVHALNSVDEDLSKADELLPDLSAHERLALIEEWQRRTEES